MLDPKFVLDHFDEVRQRLETRGPDHVEEILRALRERGYEVEMIGR